MHYLEFFCQEQLSLINHYYLFYWRTVHTVHIEILKCVIFPISFQ